MNITPLIRDSCAILVKVSASDIVVGEPKADFSIFKLAAKLADARLFQKALNLSEKVVDKRPKLSLVIENVEGINVSANIA
jgi:hypothetical protein